MVLALLEPFDEYEAKMLKKAIYVKFSFIFHYRALALLKNIIIYSF